MAVYVDDMYLTRLGRYGLMRMSHMIADTEEELHAMADAIGVQRKWHQSAGTPRSHYDIALAKRELALQLGAVGITMREAACMVARRTHTGSLGPPGDAVRWRSERVGRASARGGP